jgi:WD40 repeat protein
MFATTARSETAAVTVAVTRVDALADAARVGAGDRPPESHRIAGILDSALEERADCIGVRSLAVLPDGRLASASGDGSVHLWNVRSGICEATWKGYSPNGLTVSPDGRLFIYSFDGTVHEWSARDGVGVLSREGLGRVSSMIVLPDGRFAACCWYGQDKDLRENDIQVWAGKGDPCTLFKGHTRVVRCLALLPSGGFASGSYDNTVRIWSVLTGECTRVLPVDMPVDHLIPVGSSSLACASAHSAKINVWDSEHTFALDAGNYVTALVALPHDRIACGDTPTGCITVWNVKTGERDVSIHAHRGGVWSLAALCDGRLASSGNDTLIKLWT